MNKLFKCRVDAQESEFPAKTEIPDEQPAGPLRAVVRSVARLRSPLAKVPQHR